MKPGGSSPLARGLLPGGHRIDRAPRIIPARAGSTNIVGDLNGAMKDHPRSRGVYLRGMYLDVNEWGSSPLARGLLTINLDDTVTEWIIPARAGSTQERRFPLCANRIIPARAGSTMKAQEPGYESSDHPRSRGVYRHYQQASNGARGSSPLARGLHYDSDRCSVRSWIIPARAGSTVEA